MYSVYVGDAWPLLGERARKPFAGLKVFLRAGRFYCGPYVICNRCCPHFFLWSEHALSHMHADMRGMKIDSYYLWSYGCDLLELRSSMAFLASSAPSPVVVPPNP